MRIFPSFAVWTSFPLLFPACFGLISFFSSWPANPTDWNLVVEPSI
jgi:hypothetical protein